MLPFRTEQELRGFVLAHAPELMAALEEKLFRRIARKQRWSQISLPLRVYLLGLLTGDGSVAQSSVALRLQVILGQVHNGCKLRHGKTSRTLTILTKHRLYLAACCRGATGRRSCCVQ